LICRDFGLLEWYQLDKIPYGQKRRAAIDPMINRRSFIAPARLNGGH
jgi:hypothetical protein